MRSRRTARTWALVAAAALGSVGAAPAAEEHDYVGWAKCKTCHGKELMGDQVATWKRGPHHRAFETLKSEASRAIAAERGIAGPAHEADACLSCHSTAHGVSPVRIAYDLHLADGVQCESCHGPGKDYRKKKVMSDPERAHAEGLWHADEDDAICTACHNSESPTFDPGRYTLEDGTTTGFDPAQARARIAHPIPEDVKGRYLELEEAQRDAEED